MYQYNNIFNKIINKQLQVNLVYEDNSVIAFHDINPVAPIHILVIPKNQYNDFSDFMSSANDNEIKNFFDKVYYIINYLELTDYRIVTNTGTKSGQTVFHFHIHIISGKVLGTIIGNSNEQKI